MIHYKKMGYLNENFRIFHLTDSKKKEFEYHYHDFNKVLIFIKGNVNYSIEGRNYSLQPYDIVLINAGEIHRPDILDSGDYERIIIYISKEFIETYKTENYDLNYCFNKASKEKSNVMRIEQFHHNKLFEISKKLERSFGNQDFANDLYQKISFLEFMIFLNRATIHDGVDYLDTSICNDKIQQIISYIHLHISEEDALSIDSIAGHFFVSRYYLMHLFKESTGVSINSYINTKRLILAKSLILSDIAITEACYQCGFHNYSTFSRAFRKLYGISPRELLSKEKS